MKSLTVAGDNDKKEDYYVRLRSRMTRWLQKKGADGRWTELLATAPDLFYLLWKLSLDQEVPAKSRGILAAAVVYFVSPLDLLPEAIFGPIGFLDDIALAAFVLNRLINDTSPNIVRKYWAGEHDVLIVIKNILSRADTLLGSGMWKKLKKRVG